MRVDLGRGPVQRLRACGRRDVTVDIMSAAAFHGKGSKNSSGMRAFAMALFTPKEEDYRAMAQT